MNRQRQNLDKNGNSKIAKMKKKPPPLHWKG